MPSAVDISAALKGHEAVLLDNGTTLNVDHVVLTSGHTWNDEPEGDSGVHYLRPYPVSYFDQSAPPGSSVAVAGMGLVGFDVLTALTVGRGGTFETEGERKRYVPSGQEPAITLYSRSGVPYCAKSAHGVDPYGQYQPVVCTPEEFAALTNPGGSPVRRHVDFRTELLPLIFAEMQARYYTHAAFLAGGEAESARARAVLRDGWVDGHYEKAVDSLELRFGRFDPATHVFAGSDRHYTSAADYQGQVYDMIETDLDEALRPSGAVRSRLPRKCCASCATSFARSSSSAGSPSSPTSTSSPTSGAGSTGWRPGRRRCAPSSCSACSTPAWSVPRSARPRR